MVSMDEQAIHEAVVTVDGGPPANRLDSTAVAERAARRAQFEREALVHLDALYSFALKLARARDDAEDLVSDTLLRALERWEQYHLGTNIRAWLFTTARRKVQNRARDLEREKRDAAREVQGVEEAQLASLGAAYARVTNPGERALRNEEIARLESAIESLPEEQREVLTLAHFVGLSRAEIARQLGKTEEGVRSMLHRAMARLSLLLDAK